MNISEKGLDLIKQFEGYRPNAYNDGVGVITIGYGTTRYPNGAKVLLGEKCTEEQANFWLFADVRKAEKKVNNLIFGKELTQCQFDALVSFEYNTGALASSTLYKKAAIDPYDPEIFEYSMENPTDSCEFLKWVKGTKAGKKIILKGLVIRRMAEADLYKSLV